MARKFLFVATFIAFLLGTMVLSQPIHAAPPFQGPISRQLVSGGTSQLRAGGTGSDAIQQPELLLDKDALSEHPPVNRSFSTKHGPKHLNAAPPVVNPSPIGGTLGLGVSFDGLNHRNQRLANGGNQFSLEPPDQGLCAGNGFVMETINDVIRVFDYSGAPVTGVIDQNSFYGYPPAINRTTGVAGPFVTDPSCYYDSDVQRWFHVVLTLDTLPNGDFTGGNHLDLAVSQTNDPTGTWNIFHLRTEDDGTQGTPDHHCPQNNDGSGHGPCLGDYPHLGADANGIYLTTNEYAFFPDNIFITAQIYAISKQALASGAANPKVIQFDNLFVDKASTPGFTVWPATSPQGQFNSDNGGTEFFLSSMAAEEAGNAQGYDNRLGLWAMFNTSSLNNANPSLKLSNRSIGSQTYGVPPKSEQKTGDIPLGECINDTTIPTPFGVGCWNLFFVDEPAHDEVESHLDSNDSRMQQVTYVNGLVYGSLDTVVSVSGQTKAGVAWFVVQPNIIGSGNGLKVGPQSKVTKQGYIAVANNNLTYPALSVLGNGKGVMAFTLVGNDYYPSAGYVTLNGNGPSGVHVAANGLGPSDGFTSYKAFVGDPPRTRWGDYGYAAVVGNDIWIASEYIAQTCTLTQYLTGAIGSCGGTRTALGNWGTRISKVTP